MAGYNGNCDHVVFDSVRPLMGQRSSTSSSSFFSSPYVCTFALPPQGQKHGSVDAKPLVLSTMAAPKLLISLPSPSSLNSNGQLRAPLFFFSPRISGSNLKRFRVRAIQERTKEVENPSPSSSSSSAEEVAKKYGLEAGLWQIFSSKEEGKAEDGGEKRKSKADQAKELLAKYGGAYLATSITLSLISLSLCYALISAGVDVQSLLQKVGISVDETGEKVGTFALAYAAHKAASPIRFPPTVALTPIVAGWIGKKVNKEQ